MTEKQLSPSERQKYLDKGYNDIQVVYLRNGGMFSPDDGTYSIWNLFWKFYPYMLLTSYSVLLSLLFISMYAERKNIDNFLEVAHYIIMMSSLSVGNIDFLYFRKDLDTLVGYIGTEFFHYDEEESEVHKKMKADNLKEVKRICQIGVALYSSIALVILVVQPYLYYLATKDMEVKETSLNPYLPVPMYFPWRTFTRDGFIIAFIIQTFGTVLIVSNVVANNFCYVNLIVLFRCQLQILNHSLLNIEIRAVDRYRRKYGVKLEYNDVRNEIDLNEDFKKCVYQCLRQNILHHQCLLRWEIVSRKMLRLILLFVFFNASLLMASTGYLLVKNLDSKVRSFKFIQLLGSEIFHTFLYCFYGEQVYQQSEDLYQNLYDMQWYRYGPKFASLLSIMMTIAVRPIRSLTAIFNTPCSLETFNALMSSAYSYFSLINGAKENI